MSKSTAKPAGGTKKGARAGVHKPTILDDGKVHPAETIVLKNHIQKKAK